MKTRFWLQIVALGLALCVAPAGAQQAKKRILPPKARAGKQARLLERFNRLSPEEQERVLRNLPPERRRQLQRNLERYNELSPQQRRRLEGELDAFREMPPEKQQEARRLFRRVNGLPDNRRAALREEFLRLRALSGPERKSRLASEEFRKEFNDGDRQLIEEWNELFPE